MKKAMGTLCLCVSLFPTGCAVRKYHAVPISPPAAAAAFESRSLDSAGLKAFVDQALGHSPGTWPPKSWDPVALTLAALYYHCDIAAARAGVAVAKAGVITAGARPNPSIRVAPGSESDPVNPFIFSVTPTIPIETGGKRGLRIQIAERMIDVAHLQLAETAWQVRVRVRVALLDLLIASQNLDLLHSEEKVQAERARLLQQQFEAGEIPRPDVDTVQIESANLQLAVRAAEGTQQQARVVLAAAIGIPVSALDGIELTWPTLEQPPSLASLSPDAIQRAAVLNRLDIRRSLAQYAVAEAMLQSEIAKQYPDLQIGPGYSYDDGINKYTVGLSVTIPLFNRNQGPIAEAEARRKQAEERFLAVQAQVIGESEKALVGYKAALSELQQASTALAMQKRKQRLAQKAFDAGEIDKLSLTGGALQTEVAARARLHALARVQSALGALENAVQEPLEPAWIVPNLPSSTHPQTDLLKEPTK